MSGPLAGMKVLDFTTLLPGPYCTMCLADLGAEVIRIASRTRLDMGNFMPPYVPGTDTSASIAYLGRNKRCLTLNLKDERAFTIIRKLMVEQDFDIVVEQFRPGVMTRLNLDYQSLRKVKSDVIYCSITGYGNDGPKKAGHDINYISRSGIASYSGRKGQVPPLMGMLIADVASGSYNAIIGILAAVHHRNVTGIGQSIDISMTDGMIAFNTFFAANYLVDSKQQVEQETEFVNGGSLYDYYETKDGEYISFGGLEPKFFENFCTTIGRPDLIPGGVSPDNVKTAKAEVREILKSKPREEWLALFDDTDACVEPVMTLEEVFNDPFVQKRGMVVEIPYGDSKVVRQPANPIKFSETKPKYRNIGVSAASGGDTDEILREIGYSDSDIGNFKSSGLFD